ncbi:hypothetical protein [Pseudomonas sp. 6D_7.1_Bac1]|uniref:hypothetical protein n=1 Tax=Pseudomonas sp. 6D_7.1_Bac1 TaxID=2971615 RepID=UPI0021C8D734|nr:hypothetical protein [Pseudomonas sp. 6D_7.1_Bac1]MCU1750277.1 hypothetical protein [Pseudomonas sp. 6D_7.1_Bac1]
MPKHSPDHRATSFTRNLPPSKRRILHRNLMFVGITLTVIACLSLISKANAAGGSYVVDDGAINAPGECNVDLWNKSVRHDSSSNDLVVSPACTFKSLPMVQLGAEVEYSRDDGESETQLSPQLKAQLWNREDLGLQLAASASAHFVINRAHSFDGVDLSLPLTFTPIQALRLNFNAGWTQAYDNGEQNRRWTWGTGVEYDLIDSLTLIAERFGQQGGQQAWQAGPRLHIGEHIDVDLVIGRNLTEDRDQWLTTGVTLRF